LFCVGANCKNKPNKRASTVAKREGVRYDKSHLDLTVLLYTNLRLMLRRFRKKFTFPLLGKQKSPASDGGAFLLGCFCLEGVGRF
jgi:hypothetical protein